MDFRIELQCNKIFAICRDVLAADMLVFLARDSELAGIVAQYLEFRGNLNLDNSTQIGEMKPRLEMIRSTRRGFPIFGCALKDHISWFNLESGIAYPLQLCISKLIELGQYFIGTKALNA